jgi:L-threonylcarbamoyladenylate synthase
LESTVLDVSASCILRPGGTPQSTIETLIGPLAAAAPGGCIVSPGQLKSHYAPSKPLYPHTETEMRRLVFSADAAYLFFNQASFDAFFENNKLSAGLLGYGNRVFILSRRGSLTQAAARLFDTLHTIDALPIRLIHAERPPNTGLGAAINDRLSRAAGVC